MGHKWEPDGGRLGGKGQWRAVPRVGMLFSEKKGICREPG